MYYYKISAVSEVYSEHSHSTLHVRRDLNAPTCGVRFFLHDYAWATEKNNLIHKMSFLLHFIIFEYLSAVNAM